MDILVKVRNLRNLDWRWHTKKGLGTGSKGEDPNMFRKRKTKTCYCGNHSCGKDIFFYEKNRRLHSYRLLKKNKTERWPSPVYGGRLESVSVGNNTAGSNPALSVPQILYLIRYNTICAGIHMWELCTTKIILEFSHLPSPKQNKNYINNELHILLERSPTNVTRPHIGWICDNMSQYQEKPRHWQDRYTTIPCFKGVVGRFMNIETTQIE